jgi:hypothetical protein
MEKQAKQPKSKKLEAFFDNRTVKIVFGLFCLAAAYVFASWAIDSGSLLDYAITLLFIIIGLRELLEGVFNKKRKRS